MSSPELPDNTDFLKSALDHIKDLHPAMRFVLVFFILIIFIAMFGLVIPDQFMPLIYIVLVGGMLFYLAWEFQQHKAKRDTTKDEYDQIYRLEQLKNEDRERERQSKKRPPLPPPPTNDLQADYLDWTARKAKNVSLQGIDPEAAKNVEAAKLDLNAIYTGLLTTNSKNEELTAHARQNPSDTPRRISALAQLDKEKRLVLLGDPGSGKSTFMQFVAFCLAEELLSPNRTEGGIVQLTAPLPKDDGEDEDERQPWTHGGLLPLRIVLRDFSARGLPKENGESCTVNHLWAFVEQELKRDNAAHINPFLPILKQRFKDGKGILLLDGLDEVPKGATHQQRVQIQNLVESFDRTYTASRIVITSRPYGYAGCTLDRFVSVQLAPFSPGQIRRFTKKWYAYVARVQGISSQEEERKAAALQEAIFSRPRLYDLVKIPLLLTFTASLHAWRKGQLPRDRQKLYEGVVDLLLNIWEQRQKVDDGHGEQMLPSLKSYLNIDQDALLKTLDRLAYESWDSSTTAGKGVSIPHKKLRDELYEIKANKKATLEELETYLRDRSGILADDGAGGYIFPHRTLQEYLAARYAPNAPKTERFSRGKAGLAERARENPAHWREVLALTAARAMEYEVDSLWGLAQQVYPPAMQTVDTTEETIWGAHLAGLLLTDAVKAEDRHDDEHADYKAVLCTGLVTALAASDHLPANERALAGQSLSKLGDPRPEIMDVDQMRFCYVPSGDFYMGSKNDSLKVDDRLHYDYWMSQYPVSNAQFAAFMQDGGYQQGKYWREAKKVKIWRDGEIHDWYGDIRTAPRDFGMPYNLLNHPVVGITWYEMLVFTRWLGDRWRKNDLLPADWGVMLPSEAEWEKAGRGGLQLPASKKPVTAADGWAKMPLSILNDDANRTYPWRGDFDSEKANVKENNIGATSTPGCFPAGASPYGVQEMSGNVWEWTRSLYDDYPNEPKDVRKALNAGTGKRRSLRGGAYYVEAEACGLARRDYGLPNDRHYNFGLRVVVSPFFTAGL